jgi:hypothetical protein
MIHFPRHPYLTSTETASSSYSMNAFVTTGILNIVKRQAKGQGKTRFREGKDKILITYE